MKKFHSVSAFIFSIIIVVLFCSGCAVRRIPDTASDDENNDGSYSPQLGTPALEDDNIAQAVKMVQGIQDAVVVTNGDIAYVGIDLDVDENMDNIYKTQSIKEKAADAVRDAASDINTVYVSADSDFVEKISKISRDIRNGKPVESFTDELNKIVK